MSALVESAATPSINPAPFGQAEYHTADDTSNFNFRVHYNPTAAKPRGTSNPNICYYKNQFHAFTKGDDYKILHYVSDD
jgi:hypothetical protein